ncbi:MAG: LmeA family phospholipid-binding protein [bacterium]|nr:LmeA family phospholipid-binding protein [bacterium]
MLRMPIEYHRSVALWRAATFFAAVLVLAVAIAVGGCGINPRRLAEKRVEAQLPRLIAPAKRYRVTLLGRHERMLQGKVKAARIVGEEVEIQPGLVLRELIVELEEIEYRQNAPLKAKSGSFHAVLSDEALQGYLRELLPPVRSPWSLVVSRLDNLRVRSRAGEIRLLIDVHTRLGVKLSGELGGQLRLKENKQVWFEASEVKVVGISVPEKVRELLAELFLNRPLIDLSGVKAPVRIERIAIGDGMLMFDGAVLVEKLAELMQG